jgi:hypothetical protein
MGVSQCTDWVFIGSNSVFVFVLETLEYVFKPNETLITITPSITP